VCEAQKTVGFVRKFSKIHSVTRLMQPPRVAARIYEIRDPCTVSNYSSRVILTYLSTSRGETERTSLPRRERERESIRPSRSNFRSIDVQTRMHFCLVEKKKKSARSGNGFVTHAVRLRAYAISPCLPSPLFSFAFSLSLSLSLSLADALPFRWPFGPFSPSPSLSFVLSSLFTIFLSGRGIAAESHRERVTLGGVERNSLAACFSA